MTCMALGRFRGMRNRHLMGWRALHGFACRGRLRRCFLFHIEATFQVSIAPGDSQMMPTLLRHRKLTASAAALALLVSAAAHGRDGNAVLGMSPSVSKTFDPVTVGLGGASLVTITLTNPDTTAAVLVSELDDVLPASVVIGGGAGATTCPNGNVSAIGGFPIFALGAGAQIPAQGSCTVTVCVMTDVTGTYTNTIPAGALQTDMGNNVDPASAILTATDDVIFADRFDGQCFN